MVLRRLPHRLQPSGSARQTTGRELQIAQALNCVNMRLKAGALREMHWHVPDEWGFVIKGRMRVHCGRPGRSRLSGRLARGTSGTSGTPRHLGVNRAPGRVDLRPRGWPSSPLRGIEDQDSRRAARLPQWVRAPGLSRLSSGFPVVLACRRLPVLVVERGGCERSSPAGHGWPAECARKEAFKLCATFDVGRIAKNPTDSRTIAALDRSSHPPYGGGVVKWVAFMVPFLQG